MRIQAIAEVDRPVFEQFLSNYFNLDGADLIKRTEIRRDWQMLPFQ
jgi:hypothetical protein